MDFPEELDVRLKEVLKRKGIERLYSHQLETWNLIRDGENVVIQTPTSSGKTLCYNLPVLDSILKSPDARAVYLFPTKALSRDQVAELYEMIGLIGEDIVAGTFDGDTPQSQRKKIRQSARIVVTNPDMLHQGIIPHHTKWVSLFSGLKYVIVDEIHVYRGVFGSHFTNIMRRLKRVARFYGSKPQFICCSATIENPKEHAENLVEERFSLVDRSGAPSGDKYFIFYNPPVVNKDFGIRANYLHQARNLARIFIENGVSTIIFALSRLNVEILTKYLKDDFEKGNPDALAGEIVAGYRGGYLPQRRREIERGLREGRIKCVVATNALELGIDIGSLDVAIIAGFPGSISSTWQQAGRAGRRGELSLAILVARSFPVDQFIIRNPEFFFSRNPERVRVNPDNVVILVEHIKCASFELPFMKGEKFGKVSVEDTEQVLKLLEHRGLIVRQDGKWYWQAEAYPAGGINIRSISSENFVVLDLDEDNSIIGEVEYHLAHVVVYPGAIYMANGEQYFIESLDWEGRKAFARKTDSDYFTRAVDYTHVRILDVYDSKKVGSIVVENGEVLVTNKAVGFKKIRFYTSENVGYGVINLPEQEMVTTAFWFTLPQSFLDDLPFSKLENISGILGLSYAMHHAAAVLIMVDVGDINRAIGDRSAEWFVKVTPFSKGVYVQAEGGEKEKKVNVEEMSDFQPAIFIFDNYPGGIGLAEDLYDRFLQLVDYTYQLIENCPCSTGCPACVGPEEETGSRNTKFIAIEILRILKQSLYL